jgi:hypothetical protein
VKGTGRGREWKNGVASAGDAAARSRGRVYGDPKAYSMDEPMGA